MKKIAMIAMFFGFVGAVHAGVSCTAEGCPSPDPQANYDANEALEALDRIEKTMTADGSCPHPLGCGYMKPDVEEESGWIETKPTDDPIITAQPTGNGGFIPPPQALGSCEIECSDVIADDYYSECMSDCENKNQASVDQNVVNFLNDIAPTPEQANELFGEQHAWTICVNLIFTPTYCLSGSKASIDAPTQTALVQCTPAGSKCCVTNPFGKDWCWTNKSRPEDEGFDDIDSIEEQPMMMTLGSCEIECRDVREDDYGKCMSDCQNKNKASVEQEQPTMTALIGRVPPPQASGDLQQCEADCDALYVPGGATHGSCMEECHVFVDDGTRASTEQPTMIAGYTCDAVYCCSDTGCWPNKAHLEVEEMDEGISEDGSVLGSAATKADTMLAGLSDCKFDCDEYHDGSQSCYDTCDKFFPQASIDAGQPTTMIASSPEPEYDIRLDTDPLCGTDPYSCFHLADNDATVVRENMQVAIPILIWVFNQLAVDNP
ncbi:hypothetical protein [Thioalkalivibrio sp. HK1]|uniref:hypothetical protein n=1 Tax=Thioalkalivibrio sp. HK1 TaxID=1469245 RepID=UPI0012DFC176|nr:hypothetical protein [Thioalkalivibrio sp. HK1]